jgi:uncharacterized protein YdaU (DUF1376 family)
MALRDQPYLPLYVQDFLTDEKLIECSASATGIYIRILCIMHKSDEYGTILLKQKDKQTDKQINNFAMKLAKQMPYSLDELISGLTELINEGVLQNGGDKLMQKRMVKDNAISIVRADAGSKGGFAKAKSIANNVANTEYEYVNENVTVNKNRNKGAKNKKFKPPTIEEVKQYFKESGFSEDCAINAFEYYTDLDWHDKNDNPVLNWKMKMRTVWFKDEHKLQEQTDFSPLNDIINTLKK